MTTTRRRRRGGGLLAATVAALAVVTAPMTAVEATETTQGNVDRFQIRGSGTTNPSKLFWWAMDKLEERAGSPVRLTYRSVGSGTGKADWADHTNGDDPDFASTDFGLEPDTAKPFLQIPFQIGAVSVFVNLPGIKTGDIKLSACTVAKIFNGDITSWDDAAIKADSGLTLPAQTIKVVYRTNGSSSTQGIKGYMQAGCSDFSTLTVDSTPLTANNNHLNPGQYGVTGSDEMRKKIGANEYSIGYIDAGHGHKDDLTEVALKNVDGQWVVTKSGDPGGFVTADIPAVVTPSLKATFPTVGSTTTTDYAGDWSTVNLFNKAGDKVWPICAFTYMHIRQSYTDTETGGLVRAFAEFVLESEVQGVVNNFLFYPLDSSFAAEAKAALSDLPNKWTFEHATGKDADGNTITRRVTNDLKTFSKRRSNYADYHRELLVADIAQLEASVAALETKVAGMKTNDDSTEKSALALGAVAFVSALIANVLAGFALRRSGCRSKSYGGGASYATSAAPTPAYDARRVIVAPTAYTQPAPVSSPAPVSYNAGPASSPAVAALPLAPAHGEENA